MTSANHVKMEPVGDGWYRARRGDRVAYIDGIEVHFAADNASQALVRAEWSLRSAEIDWRMDRRAA